MRGGVSLRPNSSLDGSFFQPPTVRMYKGVNTKILRCPNIKTHKLLSCWRIGIDLTNINHFTEDLHFLSRSSPSDGRWKMWPEVKGNTIQKQKCEESIIFVVKKRGGGGRQESRGRILKFTILFRRISWNLNYSNIYISKLKMLLSEQHLSKHRRQVIENTTSYTGRTILNWTAAVAMVEWD